MSIPRKYLFLILVFSLIVISMGAYTRLADAGLGCPDWPGCYGQLSVPTSAEEITQAESNYPEAVPVVSEKAWPEMIHRYLAGALGVAVIAIALINLYQKQRVWVSSLLILVIIIQALLGLWTVTLKLHPLVVLLHLLGGYTIASLLLLLLLGKRRGRSMIDKWAFVILGVIIMQIFFGAWTSANYAALICPDFPYCQGQLIPPLSFANAFNIFLPLNQNYEFGILGNISRVTIHLSHRYFAIITAFGIISVLVYAYYQKAAPKHIIFIVAVVLTLQAALGIMNIIYLLPKSIAVAHNLCGLLLLLSWIWLLHSLLDNTSKQ